MADTVERPVLVHARLTWRLPPTRAAPEVEAGAGYAGGVTTASDPLTVLDGPTGTALGAAGHRVSGPAFGARAALDDPETLRAIHQAYADAGATVHTANTFRAQPARLDRWREALEAAVAIAAAVARAGPGRVAGSVAPVRDCYRPDQSPGEGSRPLHRAVCRALAEAGVDLLLVETFAAPLEAWVAVEEAVATGLPVWVALTAGPQGTLMTPDDVRRAAIGAVARGAAAALVNCVDGARTLPYVEALTGLDVPIGAYANAGPMGAGLGWDRTPAAAREAARRYRDLARTWVDAGATLIGGCCGTGAAHIEALAGLASAMGGPSPE